MIKKLFQIGLLSGIIFCASTTVKAYIGLTLPQGVAKLGARTKYEAGPGSREGAPKDEKDVSFPEAVLAPLDFRPFLTLARPPMIYKTPIASGVFLSD
jgi:hypothetical protein